ncbi:MAG: Coenzyme F420 hydrogenase/dehydrogenase, beta subunit C-terminal domain [Bacteroidaceae bacterium]|nr:Coenzyme F420 hydrogenase/dehydrogenase, beta subunit C-terminal domain [Bacteroidaceae bacterium]
MGNISHIKDCYGCGLCATVCAKKIIEIKLNKKGFYEPRITDTNKCTNCGLCTDVCAFSHNTPALTQEEKSIKSWAAWSNDERVLLKCSSGGIGFEIAKQLIEKDYKLCGCRYNAEAGRAEHYIATTPEEAVQSIGSKYIQSYTVDGFKAINRKEKYIVTGTPCQIDSFRRYIRKFRVEDNFVLLDFFCHCVPSMWAWNKYTKMVEKQTGKITYASWRNKFTGWHDSWAMSLDGENTETEKVDWHDSYNLIIKGKKGFHNSRLSQGDFFYYLFLGHYGCNPACTKNCKYKYDSSSADIRIGDLWGNTYKDNEKGVSALISFTSKGKKVIEELKGVRLIEHPLDIVAEGQMKSNVKKAPTSWLVELFLKSSFGLDSNLWKMICRINRISKRISYRLKKIEK